MTTLEYWPPSACLSRKFQKECSLHYHDIFRLDEPLHPHWDIYRSNKKYLSIKKPTKSKTKTDANVHLSRKFVGEKSDLKTSEKQHGGGKNDGVDEEAKNATASKPIKFKYEPECCCCPAFHRRVVDCLVVPAFEIEQGSNRSKFKRKPLRSKLPLVTVEEEEEEGDKKGAGGDDDHQFKHSKKFKEQVDALYKNDKIKRAKIEKMKAKYEKKKPKLKEKPKKKSSDKRQKQELLNLENNLALARMADEEKYKRLLNPKKFKNKRPLYANFVTEPYPKEAITWSEDDNEKPKKKEKKKKEITKSSAEREKREKKYERKNKSYDKKVEKKSRDRRAEKKSKFRLANGRPSIASLTESMVSVDFAKRLSAH